MSEAQAAAGPDRLPWLADEPVRTAPAKPPRRNLMGWASAAVLLVAGTAFWLGTRSNAPETASTVSQPVPTATAPVEVAPQQDVRIAPAPTVTPAPAPEVRTVRAPEVRAAPQPIVRLPRREAVRRAPVTEKAVEATAEPVEQAPVVAKASEQSHAPLRPWPPRVVAGASGRLVQIGAYGSRLQAKRGWVSMVRAYPALQKLPAVVVETRNSHRRLFYRFQIGTTSQAHSEVLCQRMQRISLSCAVVGLPWKAKVER